MWSIKCIASVKCCLMPSEISQSCFTIFSLNEYLTITELNISDLLVILKSDMFTCPNYGAKWHEQLYHDHVAIHQGVTLLLQKEQTSFLTFQKVEWTGQYFVLQQHSPQCTQASIVIPCFNFWDPFSKNKWSYQRLTSLGGSQTPFFLFWGLTMMIKCPGVGQLFSTASIAVATSWGVASGLRESITDCTSFWERQQTCNCSLSFRRTSLFILSFRVKSHLNRTIACKNRSLGAPKIPFECRYIIHFERAFQSSNITQSYLDEPYSGNIMTWQNSRSRFPHIIKCIGRSNSVIHSFMHVLILNDHRFRWWMMRPSHTASHMSWHWASSWDHAFRIICTQVPTSFQFVVRIRCGWPSQMWRRRATSFNFTVRIRRGWPLRIWRWRATRRQFRGQSSILFSPWWHGASCEWARTRDTIFSPSGRLTATLRGKWWSVWAHSLISPTPVENPTREGGLRRIRCVPKRCDVFGSFYSFKVTWRAWSMSIVDTGPRWWSRLTTWYCFRTFAACTVKEICGLGRPRWRPSSKRWSYERRRRTCHMPRGIRRSMIRLTLGIPAWRTRTRAVIAKSFPMLGITTAPLMIVETFTFWTKIMSEPWFTAFETWGRKRVMRMIWQRRDRLIFWAIRCCGNSTTRWHVTACYNGTNHCARARRWCLTDLRCR